ncbi:MAG: hypothetical protein HUU49_03375 [Candidatus Buchananbacteria bacterium]|nr:hypothetical protein [Candidatus Buchananbacteria bacterium]
MTDPFTDYSAPLSVNEHRSQKKHWSWLIGGGVLCLVLVSCFFWWWLKKITVDPFITLAPIDSVFYLTARDSVMPWGAGITDIPIISLFSDFNLLVDKSTRVSYVLVPNSSNGLEPVYFFQINHLTDLENVISQFPHHYQGDNYIVIAKNQETLDKILEVQKAKTFSASVVIENQFSNQQVSFVLSSHNLKQYLSAYPELQYRLLAKLITKDIVGVLNQKSDQWIFEIKNNIGGTSTTPIITSLPQDFKVFFSGVNLFAVFQNWGEADLGIDAAFKQVVNGLLSVYDFDVTSLVTNIINRPADIILFDAGSSNVFGFDFMMVFDLVPEAELAGLEKLVTIILAQKFPQEVVRVLPDQSVVTELKAEPEYWQWQTEEISTSSVIHYVSEPRVDFNFAYAAVDGKVFVSNSPDRLKQFISGQLLPLSELTNCGVGTHQGGLAVINRGQKLFDYTLDQYVVMNQLNSQTTVGCFSY